MIATYVAHYFVNKVYLKKKKKFVESDTIEKRTRDILYTRSINSQTQELYEYVRLYSIRNKAIMMSVLCNKLLLQTVGL